MQSNLFTNSSETEVISSRNKSKLKSFVDILNGLLIIQLINVFSIVYKIIHIVAYNKKNHTMFCFVPFSMKVFFHHLSFDHM